MDILDGATARAGGTCTPFGTVLDHVVDRYSEFIIFTGVLLSNYVSTIWVIFAISGMIMASYTRAKAESSGGLKKCTVGLVGRAEKFALLIAGLILASTSLQIPILTWTIIIIGLMSHITALQRLLYTRTMRLNDQIHID
jgi:CDP-diacylglycerol--glycerol-3-phosphate 3-phosphatidyltransferase/archaetidylinositol phosphate synthase